MKTQLNNYSKIFLSLVTLIALSSCSSDDAPKDNQAPKSFEVEATAAAKGLGFSLAWTEALDPEGDAVTYEILLENVSQVDGLSGLSYELEGTTYQSTTNGVVIATDTEGATTQASFEVTTSSFVDIPDPFFEQFLLDHNIDTDGMANKQMHYINGQGIEELRIPSLSNVQSIEGIDAFVDLKIFSYNYGSLSHADFSKNTALEQLYLFSSSIREINLSQNTALLRLNIAGNRLTQLDLSANTSLEVLQCGGNSLSSSFDISYLTELKDLSVSGMGLTELNTSAYSMLEILRCSYNELEELDVSLNRHLKTLSFVDNKIESIDVSNNTELESLNVYGNQLTELDLSQNHLLENFDGSRNQFSALDFSANINIRRIYCINNGLEKLDLRIGSLLRINDFGARSNPDIVVCVDSAITTTIQNGLDPTANFSVTCE